MKLLIIVPRLTLFSFIICLSLTNLSSQCLALDYFLEASGFSCEGEDGRVCLVTNIDALSPTEECLDYVLEFEFNTGAFINTDLGDFTLHSINTEKTILRSIPIIPNSDGDLYLCMEGVIQIPASVFSTRIVHQDNSNDVLSSQQIQLDYDLQIGNEDETVYLSDLTQPGGPLLSPSEALLHSQRFTLAGTLIIDQDYLTSLSSGELTSEIRMLPEAKIKTLSGASIDLGFHRYRIHGCNEKWGEITINDGGSRLQLISTKIEDAEVGVNLQDDSEFFATKTLFLDNNIAIGALGEDDKNISINASGGFGSSVALRNNNYGVFLEHVILANIRNFRFIGNTQGVYFDDVDMLLASDNDFIENHTSFNGGLGNKFIDIRNNTIVDGTTGIFLNDYQLLNIEDNELTSCQTAYTQWGGSINAYARIMNNIFHADYGIAAITPPSRAEIQFNELVNTNYNVVVLGLGTGEHRWAIQHNPTMFAGLNGTSFANVGLINTNNARVFRNKDLIIPNAGGFINDGGPGIVINGGRNNYVGYNNIDDVSEQAILMDNSSLNTLYCNDINDASVGLQVLNNCSGSEIRGNDFSGTDRNIQYGTENNTMAFSSIQDRLGNIFDFSETGNPVTKHFGSEFEANQSQYTAAGFHTQGDDKYPFFESSSDNWFLLSPLYDEYSCPDGIVGGPDDDGIKWTKAVEAQSSLLASVVTNYGVNVATSMELKLNRHGRILEENNFPLNNLLGSWLENNYENSHSIDVIDTEQTANEVISINQTEEDELDALFVTLTTVNNGVDNDYLSWNWGENNFTINTASYVQYESDIAALISLGEDLVSLSDEKEVEIQTQMPAVLADIQALSTNDLLPLEIKQKVNAIEIKVLLKQAISMKERETLKEYAALCAAEAGEGVYQARTLLALLDKELILDYNDECLQAKEGKKSVSQQQETNFIDVGLYPNPTIDKARIQLGDKHEYELLEVQNINGVVLFEQLIQTDQQYLEVNMAQWTSGTYFLQLKGDGIPKSLRLVKH